jgi:hypothetical protein
MRALGLVAIAALFDWFALEAALTGGLFHCRARYALLIEDRHPLSPRPFI